MIIKQDEAEKVRSFDLDREAWVMLIGFQEDLRNAAVIAKVVLTIISPCFYTTKTVNKTLFLGANKQRHSDLGANNVVPHVHAII